MYAREPEPLKLRIDHGPEPNRGLTREEYVERFLPEEDPEPDWSVRSHNSLARRREIANAEGSIREVARLYNAHESTVRRYRLTYRTRVVMT